MKKIDLAANCIVSKKKRLYPFLIITSLLGIFFLTIIIAVVFNLSPLIQRATANLAYHFSTTFTQKMWSYTVRSDLYREYLEEQGIPPELILFSQQHDVENTAAISKDIVMYAERNQIDISLISIRIFSDTYEVKRELPTVEETIPSMAEDIVIESRGVPETVVFERDNVFRYEVNQANPKELSTKKIAEYSAIDSVKIFGSSSSEEAKNKIQQNLTILLDLLAQGKAIDQSLYAIETTELGEISATKLENISLNAVQFQQEPIQISPLTRSVATNVHVGTVEIAMGNCAQNILVPIYFSLETGEYRIKSLESLLQNLCEQPNPNPEEIEIASCSDCRYFPADKYHSLPETYEPPVVPITNIDPGAYLHEEAIADFEELYKAAIADGMPIRITSSYRSYYTQQATFESWVQNQLATGVDRATAEIQANQYSARPGFSEHQLGTTLDLTSAGCDPFGRACAGNGAVWNWLAENAWKYGFVISYPEGKESITGYVYEPWHYRWIGRELAAEYTSQNVLTLNLWLRAKNLWE